MRERRGVCGNRDGPASAGGCLRVERAGGRKKEAPEGGPPFGRGAHRGGSGCSVGDSGEHGAHRRERDDVR